VFISIIRPNKVVKEKYYFILKGTRRCQFLNVEARPKCGGQTGTGAGFSLSSSVLPCQLPFHQSF
jgi:hypothetical protein